MDEIEMMDDAAVEVQGAVIETTRYSAGTGNFYPLDIEYADLPEDMIEVPLEDYRAASMRGPGERLEVVEGRVRVVSVDLTGVNRRAEILTRLAEIDTASGRPSREISIAIASGEAPSPYAVDKLKSLEAEADQLRDELRGLT